MYQTAKKKIDDALAKMEAEGDDAIADVPSTPRTKRKAKSDGDEGSAKKTKKSKLDHIEGNEVHGELQHQCFFYGTVQLTLT